MNTCYIVCALDCKLDFISDETDLVIGADRGYLTLVKNKIKPNVVIGDFDSYTGEIKCENIIKYPVKKDFTDSALAIEHAISKGYKKIVIYGAIGGSFDHTLANIALLADYTKKGIDIAFVDGNNIIFAVYNGKAAFTEEAKGRISVFSYSDISLGVTEKGLLYEINNVMLKNTVPLGVSNEFIDKNAEISVENGVLIIYTAKENYEKHLTRV
ncbi:MAG: thiamine diphosphokinase [Clostridia bacterium]|nr:thiamine diphosphokinase [Clostridia bacterium]